MRSLRGYVGMLVSVYAVTASVYHLYVARFGIPTPILHRAIHLIFLVPMAFLLFPATKNSPKDRPSIPDIVLAALAFMAELFVLLDYVRISARWKYVTPVLTIEFIMGTLMVVLIIEAARRVVSGALVVIVVISIVYMFFGHHLSGIFYHKVISNSKILEVLYLLPDEGIHGGLTGASATFIFLFVLFSAVIYKMGMGEFLLRFSSALAGRFRGGPAKIAVLSSALFGTISGSSMANVYGTGSFTIPLMKRLGYPPHFAGAVETSASCGGLLMPPVMGVAAFIMAEITGIPYFSICVAAALPSLFYFSGIFIQVHLEAVKLGLVPVPQHEIPTLRSLIPEIHMLIPVVGLLGFLMFGFTAYRAAFTAIVLSFFVSLLRKNTRLGPKRLFEVLENGAKNCIVIAVTCAVAGIVTASVTITSLGLGFSNVVISISQGIKPLAMMLIMVVCMILGMGMPTTPAYILASTVGVPVMVHLGTPDLMAHLFCFYFAVLADVTPPVCMAAYCAASIAQASPMRTGFTATKLCLSGFLVPYIFVYNPALLLSGPWVKVMLTVAVVALAVGSLSGFFEGYSFTRLSAWERLGMLVSGALFFLAATRIQTPGFEGILIVPLVVSGVVLVSNMRKARRMAALEATSG